MDLDSCKARIIEYLHENLVIDEADELPMDQSLLELGFLDSYGVIELVTFLESEFSIEIPNEDLTKEKFGSINKMSTYVSEKKVQEGA